MESIRELAAKHPSRIADRLTLIRLQAITASRLLYSRFPQHNEFDESDPATSQVISRRSLAKATMPNAQTC